MEMPAGAIEEIYLKPGDFHFGQGSLRIDTVLGSCVAITLWHPLLIHGGMCHFRLPKSPAGFSQPDGNYADGALGLFMAELHRRKTYASHYEVGIFGGANMFEGDTPALMQIGAQNIEAARRLLDQYGFSITQVHVGGFGRCRVELDVWSGETRVQQIDHRKSA